MNANLELQNKIDKKQQNTQEEKIEKDISSERLKLAQQKIADIQKQKKDLEDSESKLRERLKVLKAENNEWASKTQQIYIQMQQDEVQREKRNYNKNLRLAEVISQRDEQREMIEDLKAKINEMKMAEAVAETQRKL